MSASSARDQILARIRAANARSAPDVSPPVSSAASSAASSAGSPAGSSAAGSAAASSAAAANAADVDAAYRAIPRDYLAAHHAQDIVALFAERTADYRAIVSRVPAGDVAAAVAQAVPGAGRFVIPDGLPPDWLPSGIETIGDDPALSPAQLDAAAGVITGCAVAIAETGTIILDHGPGQGRRALTLVPDFHLVIVRADQVEPDLAGAFGRLEPARPHTLISGPSATSDIELIRVEGVHGPRTLHVLLVD
jgi:L-lactate dehydrogenase complex protein LldG